MYEYDYTSEIGEGDVIQCDMYLEPYLTKDGIYLVVGMSHGGRLRVIDNSGDDYYLCKTRAKKVKTKSFESVKVGDHIIRTSIKSKFDYGDEHIVSKVEEVEAVETGIIRVKGSNIDIHMYDCKVLCFAETISAITDGVSAFDSMSTESVYTSSHFDDMIDSMSKVFERLNKLEEKENKMENVEIKVNGKVVVANEANVKVKTDLQKRKSWLGELYDTEGKYVKTLDASKESTLVKELQKPEYLGFTMLTFKAKSKSFTKVPVVTKDI